MSLRTLLGTTTVLLALTASCAEATPPPAVSRGDAPSQPAPVSARLGEARSLLARLRRGELPGGVARVTRELEDAARAEGRGARAREALRLAADLSASRWRVARERRDLDRAVGLLEPLASRPDAHGCAALAALGDLLGAAGDRAASRRAYLAYERRCPRGEDLAHVHATLALTEPAVAAAAADVARARGAPRGARGGADGAQVARRAGRWLRRVVIDPGHGGSDPGARGPTGLAESAVTLDVARRLADRVAADLGVDVVLTRDADEYVPLEDRAARANAAGADLFVSIHCNSSENPASRGVSTYVLDTTDDRVAARVAARENGAVDADRLADPDVFRILADLRLVGQGSRSVRLATTIQRSILDALAPRYPDVVDAGVHRARFAVLVGARMPAVLVELSFVSNPVEESRLRDPAYRDALAGALARAIARPVE